MAEINDVVNYLVSKYPAEKREHLSKARLTKMVYLADWKSSLDHGEQITDIEWFFHRYGPYVSDVVEAVLNDDKLHIKTTSNAYGYPKETIEVLSPGFHPSLTERDVKVLDHVVKTTENKSWDDFLKLVYSTYPIVKESRFSTLDLVVLAREYRDIRDTL